MTILFKYLIIIYYYYYLKLYRKKKSFLKLNFLLYIKNLIINKILF